ncbi:hypothetical protein VZT92_012384 [Zoarces viviparus]|uniref:Uncharacterized protein n=1 Tax=Zoarces viviparus TaxID=48416 RepID=A0AAW1F8G4_ZOAVI
MLVYKEKNTLLTFLPQKLSCSSCCFCLVVRSLGQEVEPPCFTSCLLGGFCLSSDTFNTFYSHLQCRHLAAAQRLPLTLLSCVGEKVSMHPAERGETLTSFCTVNTHIYQQQPPALVCVRNHLALRKEEQVEQLMRPVNSCFTFSLVCSVKVVM